MWLQWLRRLTAGLCCDRYRESKLSMSTTILEGLCPPLSVISRQRWASVISDGLSIRRGAAEAIFDPSLIALSRTRLVWDVSSAQVPVGAPTKLAPSSGLTDNTRCNFPGLLFYIYQHRSHTIRDWDAFRNPPGPHFGRIRRP